MAGPIPADAVSPPPPRRLRRYILGALAAALVLAAGYCFGYEPPYRGTLVERPPRPLIFAHRGFGDHGPDNSLYAVEHALRAGMDGVDMDGQLTRDSELVIFHDLSVDRLTSGVGRVRERRHGATERGAIARGDVREPARHVARGAGSGDTRKDRIEHRDDRACERIGRSRPRAARVQH